MLRALGYEDMQGMKRSQALMWDTARSTLQAFLSN